MLKMSDVPQNTQDLVRLLTEQTESGRRSWEEGSADTEFVFVHDQGSLVVSTSEEDVFELRIMDPDGAQLQRYDSTDPGSEIFARLYAAAEKSAVPDSSQIVDRILAALAMPPAEEFNDRLNSVVGRVRAAEGDAPKQAQLIKPLVVLAVEDLARSGKTTFKWGVLNQKFPSGNGVRNAVGNAFRELRDEGRITCSVHPEPQAGEGFSGKTIRLESAG